MLDELKKYLRSTPRKELLQEAKIISDKYGECNSFPVASMLSGWESYYDPLIYNDGIVINEIKKTGSEFNRACFFL